VRRGRDWRVRKVLMGGTGEMADGLERAGARGGVFSFPFIFPFFQGFGEEKD